MGKNGEGSPITIERVCLHIFLQRNYIECFILVSWVVVFAGGWGQWQNHPCSSSKEEMCTIFYYTVHSKIIWLSTILVVWVLLYPLKIDSTNLDFFIIIIFFMREGKLIAEKSYLVLPRPDQHYHIWELQHKM